MEASAIRWIIGVGAPFGIALALTFLGAIAAAFPLGLFFGGDVAAARGVATLVIAVPSFVWAARTARHAMHVTPEWAQPWPAEHRGAFAARGLLTRSGQPGPVACSYGLLHVDLVAGDIVRRSVSVPAGGRIIVVASGSDAVARIVRLPGSDTIAESASGCGPVRIAVDGPVEIVLARAADAAARRVPASAWWIVERP